jgi:hypothetical protein
MARSRGQREAENRKRHGRGSGPLVLTRTGVLRLRGEPAGGACALCTWSAKTRIPAVIRVGASRWEGRVSAALLAVTGPNSPAARAVVRGRARHVVGAAGLAVNARWAGWTGVEL